MCATMTDGNNISNFFQIIDGHDYLKSCIRIKIIACYFKEKNDA